jgi:hypothetical protein
LFPGSYICILFYCLWIPKYCNFCLDSELSFLIHTWRSLFWLSYLGNLAILPQTIFKLFGFPTFRFWIYLVNVFPETRRVAWADNNLRTNWSKKVYIDLGHFVRWISGSWASFVLNSIFWTVFFITTCMLLAYNQNEAFQFHLLTIIDN